MPQRLFGGLRFVLARLNSLLALYSSEALSRPACWPFGSVGVDNALDASVFQDHLLVMAAALLWVFALDILTHDDVDSYPLSLLNRQAH